MQLQNLVDQPNKLPTIPKVVAELINSFNAEDVAVPTIAKLLASDAALSAKLLRLANSAYFHVSRTVGTVDEALRMLGFVMVRNLVLGNGMVAAFRNTKGMQLPQFWRYNLYTACAARWLAHHNGDNGDKAFTLGMMHSIGQLQLHAVAAAEIQPLDAQMNVLDAGRADLELQTLGFHYGDVSAALGEIWNFPSLLTNTLREIPLPLKATTFNRDAGWIHLAAWRARVEVLELEDEAIIASYPAAVAKRLNLSSDWVPLLNSSATNKIFSGKVADAAMPPFAELAAGLDAMLE